MFYTRAIMETIEVVTMTCRFKGWPPAVQSYNSQH